MIFSKEVVELSGHVSEALAEDIQQSINPEAPRISLRQCTSIDDNGLKLLTTLNRAKVEVRDASTELLALLEDYRRTGPAAPLLTP